MDGSEVTSGKVDVLTRLQSIPQPTIERMQRTISANAHHLHWGYDDAPGDAMDATLVQLASLPEGGVTLDTHRDHRRQLGHR